MEDAGSDAVVGGQLFNLRAGAARDDFAGDETGGVGAMGLVERVNGGLCFGARHMSGCSVHAVSAAARGWGKGLGVG